MTLKRETKHMGKVVEMQLSVGELHHLRQIILGWQEISPDLGYYKERIVATKFLKLTMEENDADCEV